MNELQPSDFLPSGALSPVSRTYQAVDLFLFSAATWNAHRVHYDRQYVQAVEGHPDLLVQGPLQAAEMFRILQDSLLPGASLRSVRYRHQAPLWAGEEVIVAGKVIELDGATQTATVELWMEVAHSGVRTTEATAQLTLA